MSLSANTEEKLRQTKNSDEIVYKQFIFHPKIPREELKNWSNKQDIQVASIQ